MTQDDKDTLYNKGYDEGQKAKLADVPLPQAWATQTLDPATDPYKVGFIAGWLDPYAE